MQQRRRELKLLMLGNQGVGKRCFVERFVQGNYVGDLWDPYMEDTWRKQIEVDGEVQMLEIIETHGNSEFNAMRDVYINRCDVLLVMYAINNRDSFVEMIPTYMELISKIKDEEIQTLPVVLIGLKKDLDDAREVSVEEGQAAAEKYGALFFEVSSKRDSQSNIHEVIMAAYRRAEEKGVLCYPMEDIFKKKASRWEKLNFKLKSKRKKQDHLIKKKRELLEWHRSMAKEQKKEAQLQKWEEEKKMPEVTVIPSTYTQDLRAFINNEHFSDIKFIIAEEFQGAGRIIHGHLCILISHFHGIFERLELLKTETVVEQKPKDGGGNLWTIFFADCSAISEERRVELAKLFTDNGLEASDLGQFDHDLLTSMGIDKAKERLEILKLAKNKGGKKEKKKVTKGQEREKEKEKEKKRAKKGQEKEKEREKEKGGALDHGPGVQEIKYYSVPADYDIFLLIVEYVYCKELHPNVPTQHLDRLRTTAHRLAVYPLLSLVDEKKKLLAGENVPAQPPLPPSKHVNILVDNELFSDVKFIVEGKAVFAHKAFLGCRSAYFFNMFCSGLKESNEAQIDLSVASCEGFKAVLKYLYSNIQDIDENIVMEVFFLAHMYELPHLMSVCEKVICNCIDESNCISLLNLADKYERPELKKRCEHFIQYNFDEVSATKEFKDLPKEVQEQLEANKKTLQL